MKLLESEYDARAFVAERCSSAAMALLDRLGEKLRNENLRQNLIAAGTADTLWLRHIADSAQLIDHVSRETSPWIDLGSGAGFPGLVIAIMQPYRRIILIESRKLRIQWLSEMIGLLRLSNCQVVGSAVQTATRMDAAVISARAFAPLPRLIQLSARFSTQSTEWVLPKGRSAEQDIACLPEPLRERFHVEHSVTDQEARIALARGKLEIST